MVDVDPSSERPNEIANDHVPGIEAGPCWDRADGSGLQVLSWTSEERVNYPAVSPPPPARG
jgi:hypothetical protein